MVSLKGATVTAEGYGLWKRPDNWDTMTEAQRDDTMYAWLADLWKRRDDDAEAKRFFDENPIVREALAVAESTRPPEEFVFARPTIRTRNLIYHVCPLMANDGWRQNVRQLVKRIDLFNGQRAIAIAQGEGLEPAAEVLRAFGKAASTLKTVMLLPNDPVLREVVTFLPLLLTVAVDDPEQATFYAHTKGNSTSNSVLGSVLWRNAMYHQLLDKWERCMQALPIYAAVGCHKMIWPPDRPPYPTGLRFGNWMFAGTFFWFNNGRVFRDKDRNWRNVPMDRYGAEAWLSGMFPPHACLSVYQKWPEDMFPSPSPYNPALYAGEEIRDD